MIFDLKLEPQTTQDRPQDGSKRVWKVSFVNIQFCIFDFGSFCKGLESESQVQRFRN